MNVRVSFFFNSLFCNNIAQRTKGTRPLILKIDFKIQIFVTKSLRKLNYISYLTHSGGHIKKNIR